MKEKATSRLDAAITEAERFLKKAKLARVKFKPGDEDTYHSSSFASAKRASMDLTRTLSDLRKSLYA
jgi:lipid II:glycine glycyltransferase (peptidoglycan interpeptide bridge formation enzyme)